MQAPPLFTSMQRMRRIQNKYCENANNNKIHSGQKNDCKRLFRKQGSTDVWHYCFTSDIFYVLEHVCFSSSWLKSTRIIVYANVGTQTTGIWLLC